MAAEKTVKQKSSSSKMKGDHLSAKVTLAGCAEYARVYARDFNTGRQQGSALY